MRIQLEDGALIRELVAFLRDEGCIAYYESAGGAIEAIAPHLFGEGEAAMIRALVERWLRGRPGLTIKIED